MTPHLHTLTRWRIRRMFTASPETVDRSGLFSAVEHCDVCAGYYAQHQTMESALVGTDDPYTIFSMERTGAALFAALDTTSVSPSTAGRYSRILAPIGAVTATLLLVWMLLPAASGSDRIEISKTAAISPVTLVAKGAYPKNAAADVGIRLFRVTDGGTAVDDESALSINDIITFTYTQVNPRGGNLTLFGLQDTGEIRWYYPGYDGETGISIAGDKVDEPLNDGFSLSVNHRPGKLRITAVFSNEPLTKTEIERAVASWRSNAKPFEDPAPLPFAKSNAQTVQHSVIVEIGEGK